MANPCYNGPNPIKDEERLVIWKWAKEHGGANDGMPIEHVANAINTKFFGGMGKPEWIDDILSGRKTPFRDVATDMWKKAYNARTIIKQANDLPTIASMGKLGKTTRFLWTLPRSAAVFGHGIVFPITHAGELVVRPLSWGHLITGALRTYRAAPEFFGLGSRVGGGKAYAARQLSKMEQTRLTGNLQGIIKGDSLFDLGLRSGVDMGIRSRPSGLISRTYHGAASRAWDMLTVMRFNLWKSQMLRNLKPGMTEAEALDIGKHYAEWANHATGSGAGWFANAAGDYAFGPKLTQSKLNRLTTDVAQTLDTFQKMARGIETTAGERAVAWTRLSGATQATVGTLGFLAVNQGLLKAMGSKEEINWANPFRGDWFGFKGGGITGYVPGLHTEIRTMARILAVAFESKKPPGWYPQWAKQQAVAFAKEAKGESKLSQTAKIGGLYFLGKATPSIQRITEALMGQDWLGRPMPWSSETGTAYKPKLSWGQYLADIGPIPLSGPVGFFYDRVRKAGASSLDAMAITKGLIIGGLGLPGFHVHEEFAPNISHGSLHPGGGAHRRKH